MTGLLLIGAIEIYYKLQVMITDVSYQWHHVGTGECANLFIQQPKNDLQTILLCLNLPDCDSLELLKIIKSHERTSHLPVILIAETTDTESLIRGIKLGADAYLVEPLVEDMCLAVLHSVLHTAKDRVGQLVHHQMKFLTKLIPRIEFAFKTIDEGDSIARFVADNAANYGDAYFGIHELVINAIEHGNLGISYEEKTQLQRDDRWMSEISRRLSLPDYQDKTVHMTMTRDKGLLQIVIRDQGNGFNWRQYTDFNPKRLYDYHGRGIMFAKIKCFSKITYNDLGNEVHVELPAKID